MKMIVACGGTSGHVNPAIAIAQEYRYRHPESEILFIGTENKIEADLVPRAGFEMEFIDITGVSRGKSWKSVKHNVITVVKYIKASAKVKKIIRKFKPDIVLGTGGYVSAPVLKTAQNMGYKTVIHEQNAYPGMVTKLCSGKANRILLSFPLAKPLKADPDKMAVVGNPVSKDFLTLDKSEARAKLGIPADKKFILSFGGSLGAKTLDDAFVEMADLSSREGNIIHYHGASGDYARVKANLGPNYENPNIKLFEYIYNMPVCMAAADLIIARSGAMTLTEIAALGKASILIPSPNVAENHQYFNAKSYSDAGAAVLLEEKDLSGKELYREAVAILQNESLRLSMEQSAKKLSKEHAAEEICDFIDELL